MKRTLITLIDYSQAFDTVWRDNLLMKMVNMKIPNHFVRWIQNWMSNRLAYVTVNQKTSKRNLMEQGVLQGSVLSPLLFIVYINDITKNLEPRTNASLFADVALYTTNSSLDNAQKEKQKSLNSVEEWSERNKLKISVEKTVTSFCTTSTKKATWKPRILLKNQIIKYDEYPKFLGLTYDRQLTFTN